MYIYAKYAIETVCNGFLKSESIFDSLEQYKDFFSDYDLRSATPITTIPLKATGKTYREKQQSVRDVILDISSAQQDVNGEGLSWGEESMMYSWLLNMAKRYGLTKEFINEGLI